MASIKISALPNFTGSTTGSYFVMDDADLATTYKVTRENLFTGSLHGTASQAITASYSQYTENANLLDSLNSTQFARVDQANIFLGNQTIVGDLSAVNGTITGTLTAQKILVQTITSSREYITGSTIFGSDVDLNTHQFTGSVTITGSLTSNTRATLTNLTGSLFGTSSWAFNTINAKNAETASYSTTLGASLVGVSQDKVNLLSSNGSNLGLVTISAVTSSLTSSYSTTLGSTLSSPSNDQVRLLASDGSTRSTVTILAVTSSLTSSYSTTLGTSLVGVSQDKVNLLSGNGSNLGLVTISAVTSSLTASSADNFRVRSTATVVGNLTANNPNDGNTGEGIIAGTSFKIDASGTGQKAKMYVVSKDLSDIYASGLQIQFANQADDKGFGFNLNTSGDFELYTKNTSWYRGLVVTKTGQNVNVTSGSLSVSGSTSITGSLGVGTATYSATRGRIDASNDIVAFSTSDIRLKDNINPIEDSLAKIQNIQGVEYDWKPEFKEVHGYEGHDVGVIAQEIEKVLPEAIRTNDTGYLSVRYEKIIPLLVQAIKEQQKQIDSLKDIISNK